MNFNVATEIDISLLATLEERNELRLKELNLAATGGIRNNNKDNFEIHNDVDYSSNQLESKLFGEKQIDYYSKELLSIYRNYVKDRERICHIACVLVGIIRQHSITNKKFKVGFIGGGVMTQIIVDTLIRSNSCHPSEIIISTRQPELLTELKNKGVTAVYNNRRVAELVQILFIACLPSQLKYVIEDLTSSSNSMPPISTSAPSSSSTHGTKPNTNSCNTVTVALQIGYDTSRCRTLFKSTHLVVENIIHSKACLPKSKILFAALKNYFDSTTTTTTALDEAAIRSMMMKL